MAQGGNDELVRYLLSRGADIDKKTHEGISLTNRNIENLEGEGRSLRLQENLFSLDDQLNNITSNTPNIWFDLREQLEKMDFQLMC